MESSVILFNAPLLALVRSTAVPFSKEAPIALIYEESKPIPVRSDTNLLVLSLRLVISSSVIPAATALAYCCFKVLFL
jgi:hypothetical protein